MDLLKELEKGNIRPVYLFCGSEKYLMEEAMKKIESFVVDPAAKYFNYNTFQGSETSVEAVIDAAQTMPMMARRRLVVVKDADKLSSAETEKLGRYIKDPCPSTCLVLTAEKVDLRKGLFQALKDCTAKFDPVYENQLPQWIKRKAESKSKEITLDACHYLIGVVGSNLLRLENELEKAILYAGDIKEISLKDIEAVSAGSRLKSIFELTDAVGNKDKVKVVNVLGELLGNGENGVYILFMVARQLRLIWKVKTLMDAKLEPAAIGRELKIPPFLQKGIMEQARRFSGKELREIFPRLLEADASLKSGKLTDKLVLESLLLGLGNA